MRGPATVAQGLYAETAESTAAREAAAAARKLTPEPAAALEHGRPTKRDRRQLADWNRWSVTTDAS
ncbi:MAG: RNA-binding S4 domain-containing protein, partial [Caldimonas sp.]